VTTAILLVPSILKTTRHDPEDILFTSYLIGGLLFIFYFFILIFQTKTHIHFFKATARSRILRFKKRHSDEGNVQDESDEYIYDKLSTFQNFIALFIIIFVIGILAEMFAEDGISVMKEYGFSAGIAGIVIAAVAVAPEIFTAVKAAKNDQMQRVVNIAMGASTVSILLTVPILLALAHFSGIAFAMDFNALQIGALLLTIILAWKTTQDGETNYLEGISHLVFFAAYVIIAGFY
jgi:Ca2+:H+ antiporter